jgi:hypothetical protein
MERVTRAAKIDWLMPVTTIGTFRQKTHPNLNPKWSQVKEAVASFVVTKKRMQNGRIYESPRIYLPTKLTTDSNFPFAKGSLKLYVRVAGKRLVLERAPTSVLRRFGRFPSRHRPAKLRKRRH